MNMYTFIVVTCSCMDDFSWHQKWNSCDNSELHMLGI